MKKLFENLETLKDMLIGNGINDNINDYVDNLILPIKQALSIVGEHLKFEDGATAIIKDFITGKEETKHIIKVKSKDTDATINILLDTKEFDTFKECVQR